MRKIFALAAALALATVVMPAANAETVTEEYTGALGFFVAGAGLATACDNSCGLTEDAGLGPGPNVGGAALVGSAVVSNLVVSVNDEGLWGTNGGISACFFNPDGDNICDGDDYGSDWTCGSVALLGSTFPSNEAFAWVITIVATEELDVCGGTFGTVSGDLF